MGRIFLVGVAGVIGAGKSTLLDRLEESEAIQQALAHRLAGTNENPRVVYVREPTALWRKQGWLEAFYANPEQNAFAFQLAVFDSYVDQIVAEINAAPPARAGSDLVLVVERTMYCQRLFWHLQCELARSSSMQDDVYVRMWSKWRRFIPEPCLLVLLRPSDTAVAMRRVLKRSRCEEQTGVSQEYLDALYAKHDEWFADPVARPMGAPKEGIPCLHVDADVAFHDDSVPLERIAARIAATVVPLLLCSNK